MYVADNAKIRKIVHSASDWVVTTLPVSFLCCIGHLAVDAVGNVYVSNAADDTIWKLAPSGTNWAGRVIAGSVRGFRDGTNAVAMFDRPHGIVVDPQGKLYVADYGNSVIRLITPIGTNWVTTTIAGGAGLNLIDGTNRAAAFYQPAGLGLDRGGNIYVADRFNFSIRKITPIGTNWVTTTIAGKVTGGFPYPGSSDGTNRAARFYYPEDIAVDGSGIVYVADSGNNTIRRIVPAGTNWVTTTIGGRAGTNGIADGTGADARFYEPSGIAADNAGNLLVGDSNNRTIRLGTPAFVLQALASQNWLILSWPSAASNYVLETRASFDAGDHWTPLTSGIVLQGDTFVLTNRPDAPAAFFRLRK